MPQWLAAILVGAAFLTIQLLIGAFFYGRLTQKVSTLSDAAERLDVSVNALTQLTQKISTIDDRTVDHGRRISNAETVLSGPGGHGERLTALEAWRIEHRAKIDSK